MTNYNNNPKFWRMKKYKAIVSKEEQIEYIQGKMYDI